MPLIHLESLSKVFTTDEVETHALAGIHLEIETLDWATELARYNQGHYQAMAFAYSARLDPALTLDAAIGEGNVPRAHQ